MRLLPAIITLFISHLSSAALACAFTATISNGNVAVFDFSSTALSGWEIVDGVSQATKATFDTFLRNAAPTRWFVPTNDLTASADSAHIVVNWTRTENTSCPSTLPLKARVVLLVNDPVSNFVVYTPGTGITLNLANNWTVINSVSFVTIGSIDTSSASGSTTLAVALQLNKAYFPNGSINPTYNIEFIIEP
jgi:hypothetical protein